MPRVFDTPLKTNDQSLDRLLAAGLPVLLLFAASPLPPAIDQALERLARAHAGDLLIAQVAIKDNPQSVRRFGLSAFPAVVALRSEQEISRAVSVSAADLEAHTAYLLGVGPRPPERPPERPPSQAGAGIHPSPSGAGVHPTPSAAGAQPHSQAAGAASHPIHTSDAAFESDVLRASQPVLVDFWAPWCGPCRMVEPTLEKLAAEMSGHLRIVKLNVDDNPVTAGRYGVQSIPTMMIVKNGKIVDRWSGALQEPMLRMRLRPHVGG